MKGSSAALRNTADAAALLVQKFDSCGIGYFSTYGSGLTLIAAQKSCALGYYSFGHEIGHNFGAHHNIEAGRNNKFSYGHGHLIEAGQSSTGVRTIMAYNAQGHRERVNYYSNPDVTYPGTGTPTGVEGVSNNAAVITKNRFAMAALGDESSTCSSSGTPSSVTTSNPVTSTTATTSNPVTTSTSASGVNFSKRNFTFFFLVCNNNLIHVSPQPTVENCRRLCLSDSHCSSFRWIFGVCALRCF